MKSVKLTRAYLVAFCACLPLSASAQINYSSGTYSQNFDTLATTGTGITWSNNSTISGWYLFNQTAGGTDITAFNAGTGSSTTSSFYSFGSTGNSDRALGGIGGGTAYFGSPASGAVAGWIAVSFTNTTGGTLNSITFSFDGEQWRDSETVAQSMVLEYGYGASFTGVSLWTAPGGTFDYTSPQLSSAGAINGNTTGLVAGRGGTLSGQNWANNQTLWLRWIERNDANSDHGLAIDNFQFSAALVPEPGTFLLTLPGLAILARRRRK